MTDSTAPEKLVINGQEYDPEVAHELIELGSKYRQLETDLNTSLDKVVPAYTRTSQEKKQLEAELAERTAEIERLQKASQPKVEPNADVQQIRKAAREVGLLDEDVLREKGYMTKDEVKALLDEQKNLEQQATNVLKEADALAKEIDGSDGRVRFNKNAVMAYAYVNNIGDLRQAYEEMNADDNSAWKERQLEAQQRQGLTTLSASGNKKEPGRTKITNNNLGAALGEWIDTLPE